MSQRHHYLPVVLATIMVLLSLGLVGVWWWFVGEYNALPPTLSSTANSTTTSNTNTASNTNSSAATTPGTIIVDAFTKLGKTLVIDESFTAKNLPADVFAGQVGDAYVADDFAFLIVHERDMNTPVLPVDQTVTWAGVLVSNDSGATWQKWYTIVDPTVDGAKLAHNVVGIFTLDKKMYLDIADARGAGSGEGNMRRITSSNAGATWADGACYYMSMESYYKPSVADRQSVAVDGLSAGTNCAYTVAPASADVTQDWKTYTNADPVFSFKYPPTWTISEDKTNYPGQVAYIAKDPTGTDGQMIVAPKGYPGSGAPEGTVTNQAIHFGTVNGTHMTLTLPDKTIWVSYVNLEKATAPQGWEWAHPIHLTVGSKNSLDVLNLILSTFTFTDQTATKDWKTYTSTNYKYSFKYPTDARVSDYDPQYVSVYSTEASADAIRHMRFDFFVVPGTISVPTLTNPITVTINSKKATQGTIIGTPQQTATQFTVDGGVIQVYWVAGNQDEATQKQILGTLTFVD